MKEELQGFAVLDSDGNGFERWTNGEKLIIADNKKGRIQSQLEQIYLAQSVHGYNVAYGYCQKRAKELNYTFRIMNGREVEEKKRPVIEFLKGLFNKL